MDNNIEVVEAQTVKDIITISPLLRSFFNKAKPDYDYFEFLDRMKNALLDDNTKIIYVKEQEKLLGYMVATVVEDITGIAVLIFQAYSERPLLSRKMLNVIDNWTRSKGITRQFILANPENEKHFELNYGFKAKTLYMSRVLEDLNAENKEEDKEDIGEENGRTVRVT